MAHQYRQGAHRERSTWMPGLLLGALVLAMPWLTFQARRMGVSNQPQQLQGNTVYEDALATGWEAAVAVQTADSRQEWESVTTQWDRAIRLLRQTGSDNPKTVDLVNAKIAEYKIYRDYAQQRVDDILPNYQWAEITEIGGGHSYIVVDPDPYDTLMSGPPLDIDQDFTIKNLGMVNQVLATIGLPPVKPGSMEVLSNYYKVRDYPLGELLLHRSLCRESFGLSDRYDCLLKVTVQPRF